MFLIFVRATSVFHVCMICLSLVLDELFKFVFFGILFSLLMFMVPFRINIILSKPIKLCFITFKVRLSPCNFLCSIFWLCTISEVLLQTFFDCLISNIVFFRIFESLIGPPLLLVHSLNYSIMRKLLFKLLKFSPYFPLVLWLSVIWLTNHLCLLLFGQLAVFVLFDNGETLLHA